MMFRCEKGNVNIKILYNIPLSNSEFIYRVESSLRIGDQDRRWLQKTDLTNNDVVNGLRQKIETEGKM